MEYNSFCWNCKQPISQRHALDVVYVAGIFAMCVEVAIFQIVNSFKIQCVV